VLLLPPSKKKKKNTLPGVTPTHICRTNGGGGGNHALTGHRIPIYMFQKISKNQKQFPVVAYNSQNDNYLVAWEFDFFGAHNLDCGKDEG